jgi:hypothetical protein
MAVEHRAPTPEDIRYLAANMRQPDADEVRACRHEDFVTVLTQAVGESVEAHAVVIDGELASLWGVWATVVPIPGRVGVGWMLSTDCVDRRAKTWWGACKAIFPALLERWDVIISAIDIRHKQSLRWGARLGFKFDAIVPLGLDGQPFQWFRVTKEMLRV